MSAARPLKSVDYEVFGRVQGVCFRMYTEDEAKKIGVVGWVKNTSKGTVTGQVQGPEEKVNSIEFQCAARAENYPSCVAFNDEKTQDFQTLLKVIQQVQNINMMVGALVSVLAEEDEDIIPELAEWKPEKALRVLELSQQCRTTCLQAPMMEK